MKRDIKNLRDLKNALESLTPWQLDQPASIFDSDGGVQPITRVEVESEDFLVPTDEDREDMGTEEELKAKLGDKFKREEFEVAIKKGTVIIYTTDIEIEKKQV